MSSCLNFVDTVASVCSSMMVSLEGAAALFAKRQMESLDEVAVVATVGVDGDGWRSSGLVVTRSRKDNDDMLIFVGVLAVIIRGIDFVVVAVVTPHLEQLRRPALSSGVGASLRGFCSASGQHAGASSYCLITWPRRSISNLEEACNRS